MTPPNNSDVKIAVLRRTGNEDSSRAFAESVWEPCDRLKDGRELISHGANMPQGGVLWSK